jgi:hypothetical protein
MVRNLLWIAIALAAACDGEQPCIEVATDCQPLYEPVYDEVFARTLVPKCGVSGTACHSAEGARAGLILVDPDQAYDLLLGASGRARVNPGDPGCSLLVRRLASRDASFVMPPGSPLAEAEICAVVQWIANGAER